MNIVFIGLRKKLALLSILTLLTGGVQAYTITTPSVNTGDTLTALLWNQVVDDLNGINGSVGGFSGTAGSIPFAGVAGSLAEDNTNLFWDDTNNRLGIGTASPDTALTIFSSNRNAIKLHRTSNVDEIEIGRVRFQAQDSISANAIYANISARIKDPTAGAVDGQIEFSTFLDGAGTTKMVVSPEGDVGIGTSVPEGKLTVNDGDSGIGSYDFGADELLRLENDGNVYLTMLSPVSSSAQILFGQRSGLVPGYLTYNHASDELTVGSVGTGGTIMFRAGSTASNRMMRITDSGVGIGSDFTGTPTEMLDVDGNVKATAFVYSSDARLKSNFQSLSSLDDILNITPQRYTWNRTGLSDIGVVAQQVEQYFPEFVHTNQNGYKSVDYPKLVVPLIGVVQRQQQELNNLKTQLKAQGILD